MPTKHHFWRYRLTNMHMSSTFQQVNLFEFLTSTLGIFKIPSGLFGNISVAFWIFLYSVVQETRVRAVVCRGSNAGIFPLYQRPRIKWLYFVAVAHVCFVMFRYRNKVIMQRFFRFILNYKRTEIYYHSVFTRRRNWCENKV